MSPLERYMVENKVSVSSLAEAVGVSQPHITRIKSGERQPSLPLASKLAKITGLPESSFIKDQAA